MKGEELTELENEATGFWEIAPKEGGVIRKKEEDSSNRETLKILGWITGSAELFLFTGAYLAEGLDPLDWVEISLLSLPPVYFFMASKGWLPYKKYHYIQISEKSIEWCMGFLEKRFQVNVQEISEAEIRLFSLFVKLKSGQTKELSINLVVNEDVKWLKETLFQFLSERNIPVKYSSAHRK